MATFIDKILTDAAAQVLSQTASDLTVHLGSLRDGINSLKTHLNSNICSVWKDPDFVNTLANCKKLLQNGITTANNLEKMITLLKDTANDIRVELAKRAVNGSSVEKI